MMRYQRVSPDCLPLSNGKKSSNENGRSITYGLAASTNFETKGFRFRSPSRTQDHHHNHHIHNGAGLSPSHSDNHHHQTQRNDASSSPSPSPSRGGTTTGSGGDVLLQWGQKKRSRVSRSEIRSLADNESSSSVQAKQTISKLNNRRTDNKLLSGTPTMPLPPPPPPPPPPPQQYINSRCGNLRKESSSFVSHRNLEKRSVAAASNGSSPSGGAGGNNNRAVSRSMAGKRSPPTPDKNERKITTTTKDEKPNGWVDSSEQEGGGGVGEKLNAATAEVIEWPRIYIALSRKEKEDDFFAMKGTKLPQRPKKRAKNIDKTLQYCFPGMWLSDLTKSRYEVREKKCVKKPKRRGLKGMESMDSESE